MTLRELFDFVTDVTIVDDKVNDYLDKIQENIQNRQAPSAEDLVAEQVFMKSFIPRTLDDVLNYEKHISQALSGDAGDLYYQTITGLRQNLQGTQKIPSILEQDDTSENGIEGESDSGNESGSESESDEDDIGNLDSAPNTSNTQELSKKEKKKLVKEQQREKRKTKVPKHIKKSFKKKGAAKK